VGHEVQREVERADRADHAARHPDRERELALAGLRRVHRDDVPRERPRLDRGRGVCRHGPLRLDARGLHRLPGLGGDRPGHLVVPLAEERGDAVEDRGPLVRRERFRHRALGGVDGPSRLLRAGLRHPTDDVAGVGRAHLDPLAGLDPLAVEEEAALGRGRSHGVSLPRRTIGA
jgi:hypothetical protein